MFQILEWERPLLLELAVKQAEYAALPVMGQREALWRAANAGTGRTRPPVVIEEATFDRDFMPQGVLQCRSELARGIEYGLRRRIRSHELIGDDKVVPKTFQINWFADVDEFGVSILRDTVQDADGVAVGYKTRHPIQDLKRDFHLLQPARLAVDREKTLAYKRFLEELFQGALLVEIVCNGSCKSISLTSRVVDLMGMEAFFLSMYDYPDETHGLMEYLTHNALSQMRQYESEGLLRPNNGNHESMLSSFNFTDELPAKEYQGGPLRLKDMWLATNSQATVGISPAMFNEFCLPYFKRICEQAGLMYYGCCEPVSALWESSLSKLPNLKKVSISRWCDEGMMGEALAGSGIIYSRKPDPNFLSVDRKLNEDAWAKHIRATLRAGRNCQMEIIIRDVYTLHGDIGNARKAVDIARREIGRAGY